MKPSDLRESEQNLFAKNFAEEAILLPDRDFSKLIFINSILYIESYKAGKTNYSATQIHLVNAKTPIRTSLQLSDFEKRFENQTVLFRIHKSHIVNLGYITAVKVNHRSVLLHSGKELLIGEKYRDQVKQLTTKLRVK